VGEAHALRPLERNGIREARERLTQLLSDSDSVDAVEAALWVAREEYPALDVSRERDRVADLAASGARRVARKHNPFAKLDGLQAYLFGDLGYRGNVDAYDDPRNSFLNEVLDRRTGIPLTLSLLFIEVALRAGFDARGVGLPGHFVARLTLGDRTIFVDPFHEGRVITEEDCRDLVARSTGRPSLFRREQLAGVGGRAMVGRLLLNLKHVYVNRGDYARALSAVERLLLVSPGSMRELRDKGFLEAHLGRPAQAIADLERYLQLAPAAPDFESVRGRVVWLRRKLSRAG
jgi:regulator of sirC expression with transglutaminase-like and TPR domain